MFFVCYCCGVCTRYIFLFYGSILGNCTLSLFRLFCLTFLLVSRNQCSWFVSLILILVCAHQHQVVVSSFVVPMTSIFRVQPRKLDSKLFGIRWKHPKRTYMSVSTTQYSGRVWTTNEQKFQVVMMSWLDTRKQFKGAYECSSFKVTLRCTTWKLG